MAGDGEEKLVVESSVDDSQEVCFPGFNLHCKRIYNNKLQRCIIRIISLPHEYHYHRLQYFGFNFFMVTYVSRSMEKVGLASH